MPSPPTPILANIAAKLGDLERARAGSSPFKIRLKTRRGIGILIHVFFRFGGGTDRIVCLRDVFLKGPQVHFVSSVYFGGLQAVFSPVLMRSSHMFEQTQHARNECQLHVFIVPRNALVDPRESEPAIVH